MRQTSPEEAYKRLDVLAADLTKTLRKHTKAVRCLYLSLYLL